MTTALEGGEESASRPSRSLPPEKTQYPLYRRLGGTQGQSGQAWKISPPPGFDPRTIQPIASHYTDYTYTVQIKHTSGNGKYPTYILTAIYVVMEISDLNLIIMDPCIVV